MKVDRLSSVIDDLGQVLRWSAWQPSRAGYFAALYWHVASSVKEHLAIPGYFQHPEQIQQLNEMFFSRYLEALSHWWRGEPLTKSWSVAFTAIDEDGPIVLQHLLLGANAHINLDLAVAVATTFPASELPRLKPDYDRMNDLLCDLIEPVLADCCRIFPALRIATRLGGKAEATLLGTVMRFARGKAWEEAVRLSALGPDELPAAIAALDARVAGDAHLIKSPGWLPGLCLWVVRHLEHGDVREIINDLRETAEEVRSGQPGALQPAPTPGDGPFPTRAPSHGAVPLRDHTGPVAPRKVAIIGGGQSGLTAALQLSDPANPMSELLDITVHQLGWRLGGKGATGRPGPDRPWFHDRIQEHGLHNWFGFYDNAFRQMRRVYEHLGREKGQPLATFDEAFEGANEAAFVEHLVTPDGKDHDLVWAIHNITNDQQPGKGGLALSPWTYIAMALELAKRMLAGSDISDVGAGHPDLARSHEILAATAAQRGVSLDGLSMRSVGDLLGTARTLVDHASMSWGPAVDHPAVTLFDDVKELVDAALEGVQVPGWIHAIEEAGGRALCWVLSMAMDVLWDAVKDRVNTLEGTEERRLWIMANLGYAGITGAIKDGVVDHGFDVLNDRDYRAWMASHVHDDGGLAIASPIVEAAYTGMFAYPEGDTSMGPGGRWPRLENAEAGVVLRGMVRAAFTYKGSFAYRFVAGTADTCYAPAYEVLRKRGVKVEFFHRVRNLALKDGLVESIDVGIQAVPKSEYDPLRPVKGLPTWPDEPLWDQLVNGAELQAIDADLESPAEDARALEGTQLLQRGVHFDDVIIAVPISALPDLAPELIAASSAWQASVEAVKTVRTQALQAWLTVTPAEVGFPKLRPPIVTWIYDDMSPLNVWGDYPELLPQENWPADDAPKGLAYFCSTMPDAQGQRPGAPFPSQREADSFARQNAVELLTKGIATVMPGAAPDGVFDWNVLYDPRPEPGTGEERLDAQWYRANVTPTERYVLSVVGSSAARLPAHDPRTFPNVYLAGDWIQCTINAGCMEAATMGGMLASNALSGWPFRTQIIGVDF